MGGPALAERDDTPFDFGASALVQDYLRESRKLVNSKGALSEHVFLARVALRLYDTLHRRRARVHEPDRETVPVEAGRRPRRVACAPGFER